MHLTQIAFGRSNRPATAEYPNTRKPPARSGPRRRALAELAELTVDSELFVTVADGHRLIVGRQQLADRLGISRQSLWGRLTRLVDEGLATDTGRTLIVHTDRVRERITPTVVPMRNEATRRFHGAMADFHTPATAAHGTATYVRPDGRPATLRDVSETMGGRPPGTAHHHKKLVAPPQQDTPPAADRTGNHVDTTDAVAHALQAATELLAAAHRAGHQHLVAITARFADELMRIVASDLESRDVNIDARPQPRRDDALRDTQRDQTATPPRSIQELGSGLDGNSIPPLLNTDNATHQRDSLNTDNATTTDEHSEPLWAMGEWTELIGPLERAWYLRHRQTMTPVAARTIQRARKRPRDTIAQAIQRLADQVTAGVPINDPAAVLGAAIRDSNPDYFPPAPATDIAARILDERADALAANAAQAGDDPHVAAYLLVAGAPVDDTLLAQALRRVHALAPDHADELTANVLAQLDPSRRARINALLNREDTP